MTTRTDIIMDYIDSPRVMEVNAPSVEMTMQDLVDTARKQEDSFQGMSYPKLVNASGKEDLGGGVSVGITVSQQNMLLAFEGRTTPAQTGTVTTNPGSPVVGRDVFTSVGSLFQTNNVARGSLVVNFDDRSIAEVYSVDGEEQLTTKTLVNGISNTYGIGDNFHVFNVIQCNATGGNDVAVDDMDASISPILPTAFTQVVLTASSSATTQNQSALNHSVFNNAVTLEAGSPYSGTTFPVGTSQQPVNNLDDAKAIAAIQGFNALRFNGNWSFAATDVLDGYVLQGIAPSLSVFTFAAGVSTVKTIVESAEISGDLAGALDIQHCHLSTATGIGGTLAETNIHDSLFENVPDNTMQVEPNATMDINVINCDSGSPTNQPITVDWSHAQCNGTVRKWAGGYKIKNMASGQYLSFDSTGGHITVDPSCTNINLTVRGDTKITDNRVTKSPAITVENTPTLVWEYVFSSGTSAEALLALMDIIHTRLDLNAAKPSAYINDGSQIINDDFTLTRTNNGASTTVQRS